MTTIKATLQNLKNNHWGYYPRLVGVGWVEDRIPEIIEHDCYIMKCTINSEREY